MEWAGDLERIGRAGIVAVMRGMRPQTAVPVAKALRDGGIEVLELTVDAPGAIAMLEAVAEAMDGEVLVGAGTVLDTETARLAIGAGARFLFSPSLDARVVEAANRYGRIAIPGVMTPTEIVRAMEAGARVVKVFPASVLGPSFLRQVRAPLPHIPLIPTGGIDEQNAGEYLRAGAFAVGVGGSLVDRAVIARGDFQAITARAKSFVQAVRAARRPSDM